ncbi:MULTISPECIES: hypothetical protein [Pseudomonas]|uniref:Uncharacterized protein n=2 Tax=Pseudomonas TaxID=286 RepID=A0A923G1U1_9PSED|nr:MULTISPECIES: hypothetical protein [Pseudomonas]AZL69435.1 hypothetical protein EJA05_17705 [Pseudomonas oryziphila]MBV4535601.1 hypothetical protein [Pseudomonas urmiensis]UVL87136.1 hypothetical protein LOY51_15140 [Pseudomonas sichuanensis]HEN8736924.1 hypothetical protein [Pseudomonas putida]
MKRPASHKASVRGRQRGLWLLLALLLAYLFIWPLSALAALALAWLGQAPSEAVLSSSIAAFVLYPPLVLWLLCARRLVRNSLCLAAVSLVMLATLRALAGAS